MALIKPFELDEEYFAGYHYVKQITEYDKNVFKISMEMYKDANQRELRNVASTPITPHINVSIEADDMIVTLNGVNMTAKEAMRTLAYELVVKAGEQAIADKERLIVINDRLEEIQQEVEKTEELRQERQELEAEKRQIMDKQQDPNASFYADAIKD